ncbi:Pvc16 family protein [Amycolatopsis sp., V23-08]|uniref:Pvc16 family protein n=1 Tax=Amycolatopsis heterodermiae TaxID=3110235 RepID=A0ABU5RG18_9PSEU|nr:Pvc16 family protein [Amycolatopsis sp., V23-08]MEA5365221.1 Pvc16 family protein [Amycolatopsis sp., V23-08]
MLHDVDSALRTWLFAELPAEVEIAFEAPGAVTTRRGRPVLGLFLYEIGEELDGQAGTGIRLRGPDGRVTGTVLPVRRYRLTYLVTAWAATVAAEHELLGAVLAAHAGRPALEPDLLAGRLGVPAEPLPVRLGRHRAGGAEHDLWHALGVPLRTALDLTVTAPVVPARLEDPAPPVRAVALGVADEPRAAGPRWTRTSRPAPEPDTGERR